jgi:hypothetical protein
VKAVVVPPTPGAAVVKGAVIYGLNPKVVAARVGRRTYGTSVSRCFDTTVHNPKHKYYGKEEEEDWVHNVFSIYAKAGSVITQDQVVSKPLRVGFAGQSSMAVRFYSCPQANPVHVDEPMVREEGVVRIDVPGTGLGRKVIVTMKFGRTQIQASATNEHGQTMETKLTFTDSKTKEQAPLQCTHGSALRTKAMLTQTLMSAMKAHAGSKTTGATTLCELCCQAYPDPVTYHSRLPALDLLLGDVITFVVVRQEHPGCGVNVDGHGYTSQGKYKGGWVGL